MLGEGVLRCIATALRGLDHQSRREVVRSRISDKFAEQYGNIMDHCTRGEYGAHAHRRGGPLSSRPLSPSPYNAAVPKGPAFGFLNY